MKIVHLISRIFIGVVFIFSGFVKGIDPLGFAYKLEDYFAAWGTEWMAPLAVTLAILLSAMEFVLGVVVLFNIKPRQNSWILLFVMLFFTFLTLYDAIYNPVPDCGCFGDAIKLTNWQTFYKNVVLMVPTLFLFALRNKVKDKLNNVTAYTVTAFVAALFIGLCVYCYMFLPIIDFMEWKKGNKMYVDTEQLKPVEYYVTYQNKNTSETKEYLLAELPYNDSIWMSEWVFQSQRIVDPNKHLGANIQIIDSEGNDITQPIIRNPDYHFILVAWDLQASSEKGLKEMEEFAIKAENDGYTFVALTSSLDKEIANISQKLSLTYPFYQVDDVTLKTMVRANPGLLLMKDGVVIDKWSHHGFKDYDKIKRSELSK